MRIRIIRKPTLASVDGIELERFEAGREYEVGNSVGALLLAERWAEPVPLGQPPPLPFTKRKLLRPWEDNPPNLIREIHPPYLDRLDLNPVANDTSDASDTEKSRRGPLRLVPRPDRPKDD